MISNFIVCWDCQGLECIIPTSEIERQNLINILSDKPTEKSIGRTLNMLILRARANSHRFYEIYGVSAVDGIDKDDIREMFENSPQDAADIIRKLGVMIYSNRQNPSRIKIT